MGTNDSGTPMPAPAPGPPLAAAPTPPTTPAPTVVSVDDDTVIREGLLTLLTGVTVTATFPRVEDLLATRPPADVVLLDMWLQGVDPVSQPLQGVRAVSAVCGAGYQVLIYTNERRREVLAGCLAAGARGIMHKSQPIEDLAHAIAEVAAGSVVITTALAGLAEVVHRHGALPSLSPRQLDVLRGRARGETFKAIGARLYIAPKTAEEYMAEVGRRFAEYLRTHSAADLERLLGVGPGDLLDPYFNRSLATHPHENPGTSTFRPRP